MTSEPARKKLIEVALPLRAINKASAWKKSTRRSSLDIASVADAAAFGGDVALPLVQGSRAIGREHAD